MTTTQPAETAMTSTTPPQKEMNFSTCIMIAMMNNQAVRHIEARNLRLAMQSLNKAFLLTQSVLSGDANKVAAVDTVAASNRKDIVHQTRYRRRRSSTSVISTQEPQQESQTIEERPAATGAAAAVAADDLEKEASIPPQLRRSLSYSQINSHNDNDNNNDIARRFAYLRPIAMVLPKYKDKNNNMVVPSSPWNMDTIAVILTFNLAVTQHLKARDRTLGQSRRERALRRALELYNYCIGLEATSTSGVDCWDCIHAIALLNNIGLIQLELGQEDKSCKLFQRLLSLLLYLREMEVFPSDMDCTPEEWEGFLFNATTTLISRNHCFAPAA